jgi:hypothetical protein
MMPTLGDHLERAHPQWLQRTRRADLRGALGCGTSGMPQLDGQAILGPRGTCPGGKVLRAAQKRNFGQRTDSVSGRN